MRGACALAALLALLVGAWLHGRELDHALFFMVNALGPKAPRWWAACSTLGLGLSVLLITAWVSARKPQRIATLLLAVVCGGLLIQLMKLGAGSARPMGALTLHEFFQWGEPLRRSSMPSGHAAMAFMILGLVALEAPVATALRRLGLGSIGLWALCVAMSRIAVGAHWPSDVLVGAGLGLALAAGLAQSAPVERLGACIDAAPGRRGVALALAAGAVAMAVVEPGFSDVGWLHASIALLGLWAAARWWRSAQAASAPQLAT